MSLDVGRGLKPSVFREVIWMLFSAAKSYFYYNVNITIYQTKKKVIDDRR